MGGGGGGGGGGGILHTFKFVILTILLSFIILLNYFNEIFTLRNVLP